MIRDFVHWLINFYIFQRWYFNFRGYAGFNKREETNVTLILIINAENGDTSKIVGRNGRREDTINKKWAEIKRTKEDKEEEEKEEEKAKDEEKKKQKEKDEEKNKKIKRKHVICVSESTNAI
jgi:hypothetical protein